MKNLNRIRLPHLPYLKTLIAGRKSAAEIIDELTKLKLEYTPDDIKLAYSELAVQQPEYFQDKTKTVKVEHDWLRELGILDMYGYVFDEQVDIEIQGIAGAFKLLDDPSMRKLILPMSMCGVTTEDIELTIASKFDIQYEPADFTQFIKYFGDFSEWTTSDKSLFIASLQDKDQQHYFKLALDGDKNYLLWKLGVAPNKSFDQMMREMIADCFYHFKEQQKKQPENAQRWGTLAVKISDRLDRLDADTKDKNNMFDEIRFKLVPDSTSIKDSEELQAEIPPLDNIQLANLEDIILEADKL